MTEPICRCELCLALLNIAASAERTLRAHRAKPKLTLVEGGKRRKAA